MPKERFPLPAGGLLGTSRGGEAKVPGGGPGEEEEEHSRNLPAKRRRGVEAEKFTRMSQPSLKSQNSTLQKQPHNTVSRAGVLGWAAEVISGVIATFYELKW